MKTNLGQAEGKKMTCEGQPPKESAILPNIHSSTLINLSEIYKCAWIIGNYRVIYFVCRFCIVSFRYSRISHKSHTYSQIS